MNAATKTAFTMPATTGRPVGPSGSRISQASAPATASPTKNVARATVSLVRARRAVAGQGSGQDGHDEDEGILGHAAILPASPDQCRDLP
jgi:hypothetical protein